jgi:hypothetical protein
MLVKKSHSPGNKAFKSLPLIIMIVSIVFWIAYALGVIESDLTTVDCLMITLLLESAIQVGLIPSNSNYEEIFNSTTVPVMIVDEECAPQYSSETVSEIATDEMKQAENGVLNCGNILLHSQSIKAGHVLWQDDITVLNELKEQLQDTISQLDEENDMLQAEIDVKEKRAKLDEKNVVLFGDEIAREICPDIEIATDDDYYREYLDYKMSVKIVSSLDDAIEHIRKYSSGHSESIITNNIENAEKFLNSVDSSAVYHNASTRFTDGGEFGFGAEIGISTQKLHARGPLGLPQLNSFKYKIYGNGQIR